MDFNDLRLRLKRIYAELDERYDYDLKGAVKVSGGFVGGDLQLSFGRHTPEELHNIVFGAIGAIADLKDHLKNKMVLANKNPRLVEDMINGSFSYCLVIDLNNLDKHGDPLSRGYRSDKRPRIGKIHEPLSLSGGTHTISIDLDGVGAAIQSDTAKIEIMANVTDEDGAVLIGLYAMLTEALNCAEDFIECHELLHD